MPNLNGNEGYVPLEGESPYCFGCSNTTDECECPEFDCSQCSPMFHCKNTRPELPQSWCDVCAMFFTAPKDEYPNGEILY